MILLLLKVMCNINIIINEMNIIIIIISNINDI